MPLCGPTDVQRKAGPGPPLLPRGDKPGDRTGAVLEATDFTGAIETGGPASATPGAIMIAKAKKIRAGMVEILLRLDKGCTSHREP